MQLFHIDGLSTRKYSVSVTRFDSIHDRSMTVGDKVDIPMNPHT